MRKSITIFTIIGCLLTGFTTCRSQPKQGGSIASYKAKESAITNPNPNPKVTIDLQITPQEFTRSGIDQVSITLKATNNSSRTQETHLDQCKLYINGALSFSWSLTLGNGHRTEEWYRLPGKESVQITWSYLAKSLFTEPGEYALELKIGETTLQEMVVHFR